MFEQQFIERVDVYKRQVLKRYDDEGRNEADLPLVHWGVQDALYKACLLYTSRCV